MKFQGIFAEAQQADEVQELNLLLLVPLKCTQVLYGHLAQDQPKRDTHDYGW